MKKIIIATLAAAIAVVLISGVVIAGLGQSHTQGTNNDKNSDNDDDNDMDDSQNANNTAGGGGWFEDHGLKNTFGLFLDANNVTNSSFVFHARYSLVTVHCINITNVSIEDDDSDGNWTAHAYGNATVNKLGNFTFVLNVTDCGKGEFDIIDLWVDSEDISFHWGVVGLGGGNIWVMPGD